MFFLTLLNLCAYGGAKGGGAAFNRVLKKVPARTTEVVQSGR